MRIAIRQSATTASTVGCRRFLRLEVPGLEISGYQRYGYGLDELGDGIGVVRLAVVIFGLGEILATAGRARPPEVIRPRFRDRLPNRREIRESAAPIARC